MCSVLNPSPVNSEYNSIQPREKYVSDNIIACTEISKDFTKTVRTNEFSNVVGYKINMKINLICIR